MIFSRYQLVVSLFFSVNCCSQFDVFLFLSLLLLSLSLAYTVQHVRSYFPNLCLLPQWLGILVIGPSGKLYQLFYILFVFYLFSLFSFLKLNLRILILDLASFLSLIHLLLHFPSKFHFSYIPQILLCCIFIYYSVQFKKFLLKCILWLICANVHLNIQIPFWYSFFCLTLLFTSVLGIIYILLYL